MKVSLISWLVEKEKRFAWSLFGTVIGVLSLVLGYFTILEKRPEVSVVVVNESNVLDVHTPVRDLTILFQGQNVQQQNLNLRIITVRIENTGDIDILQGQYDQQQEWGFLVEPGQIIEARRVASNSEYLLRSMRPQIRGDSVVLPKVILERGKTTTFEILTLHRKETQPTIRPFGKIAGIDRLSAIRVPANNRGSFLSRTFAGSPSMQVVRSVVYFVAALSAFVLVAVTAGLLTDVRDRQRARQRKKAVLSLREYPSENERVRSFFINLFVKQDSSTLLVARKLLSDENQLRRYIKRVDSAVRRSRRGARSQEVLPSVETLQGFDPWELHRMDHYAEMTTEFRVVRDMMRAKLVGLGSDGVVEVEAGTKEALEEVLEFLERRGSLKLPNETGA